jgi:hypothetical protein
MTARPQLFSAIIEKLNYMLDSFSGSYLATQTSSKIHTRYWITIPKVTRWAGWVRGLFGFGINCSGYPFTSLFNQFPGEPWVVECDYIDYLWNYGYVGFALFYVMFFKNIIRSLKINKKYAVVILGILVEGVTYNVLFNWCFLTMILCFVCLDYRIDIFDHGKLQKDGST